MQEYKTVLKKYAVFSGRASRREYWMFVLINFLISIVLIVLDTVLGTKTEAGGLFSSLYSIAVLIPSIAVGVRRLHDTNRSGLWLLISFVPLIGFIWVIVLLAKAGDPGDNQYGPNPYATSALG